MAGVTTSSESFTIKVSGLKECEAAFPDEAMLKKILGTAVSRGAAVYRKGIRDRSSGAFKDTASKGRAAGTLRGNIKYRRVVKLGGIAAIAGPLSKGTHVDPIAHLVEEGHGGPQPAPPHPFVTPAVEEYEAAALAAVDAAIQAALDAL